MSRTFSTLLLLATIPLGGTWADDAPPTTPAEKKVLAIRQWMAGHPEDPRSLAELGLALSRRARETADTRYYAEADRMVARALELDPESYAARKARAWILLGRHEFDAARKEAEALQRRVKDDLMVYGLLVDANVELGRYDEAEDAAQWMLNLRPGNPAALTRAAYLRELFGDLEGAQQLMVEAFHTIMPTEFEDRAGRSPPTGSLRTATPHRASRRRAQREACRRAPGSARR